MLVSAVGFWGLQEQDSDRGGSPPGVRVRETGEESVTLREHGAAFLTGLSAPAETHS